MANVLRVKRNAWNASGGNAAAPAADALEYGELAWENTTGTLYIGKQINSGGTINSKRVIPDASATVIGAASFSTNNFVVNSGAVQIKDGGVVTEELADDAVTADKIADDAVGSDQVANNAVALGTQTTGNYAASISGTANEIEVTGSAGEGTTFTVGLPDAGVYTLVIPPAVGGNNYIKAELQGAANRPPDNLEFTFGFMMVGGSASTKTLQTLLTAGSA